MFCRGQSGHTVFKHIQTSPEYGSEPPTEITPFLPGSKLYKDRVSTVLRLHTRAIVRHLLPLTTVGGRKFIQTEPAAWEPRLFSCAKNASKVDAANF